MTLNKSSMMLTNFKSRIWLHKDIDMFLKNTENKAIRKKKEEKY